MLAAYFGEDVTVRYDPRDAGEIRLWHNGFFLCRAIAPELAADHIPLKALQAARTARRRQLKQQLADRRSAADALPTDDRYTLPDLTHQPVVEPNTPPTSSPPRHGLKLYAAD